MARSLQEVIKRGFANTLKQVLSFRKESKTTKLSKSKPCSYVLSCLAMFNDLLWRGLCKKSLRHGFANTLKPLKQVLSGKSQRRQSLVNQSRVIML